MFFPKEKYSYRSRIKRVLAACLDLLGYAVVYPFRLNPSMPESPARILVIRNDQLGDYLMTRPAIDRLRRRFPSAAIDILIAGELAPLAASEKIFRDILAFSEPWFPSRAGWIRTLKGIRAWVPRLRKNRYDMAIDFRGDLRNILVMFFAGIPARAGYGITGGGFLLTKCLPYPHAEHQVIVNLRLAGDPAAGETVSAESLPFFAAEHEKSEFAGKWKTMVDYAGPKVVIHPGAGYPSKRWPADRYRQVIARFLAQKRGAVILIGTHDETGLLDAREFESPDFFDLRGKTTLIDLTILFSLADLYLGNDSGPAHLAAAQGMELLILFSAVNDPRKWRPLTDRLHLITETVPCSPCERSVCPLGHHDCMNRISVDTVWERVLGILEHKAKGGAS